jgi:hypothetical protein
MAFSDTFIPKGPINVPLPNFNKGMVRNKASTVLPEGTVFLASNYNVTEKGPTRRSGSIKFAGGATVSYAPLRDTVQLFKSDGTQKIGVIDTKFLYLQSGTNLVRQGFYTSAGTIRTSGAHVRGNGATAFTAAGLRVNDAIDLKFGTASAAELLISQVVTKSHLILATVPTLTYPNGTGYKAYKGFDYNKSLFVDSTLSDSKIVFADGIRPLWAWDGATLGALTATLLFVPRAVTFWMDRLFAGYTVESGLTYRSRIRWTKTTNHKDFIASPDVQWVDRPYSPGALLRLVPMGKLLLGYYEDRIDIGRPTNIAGDTLPVYFEQVDTGGAGLVGMKAVTRFYDGHFVMLDDGIYYFSAASGVPQNIGEDIWKEATGGLKTLQGVIAAIDWQNDCVLFAIPNNSFLIQTLWAYNYKSKAWSRQEIPCTSLSVMMQTQAPTIDGAVGTIDAQTGTFDDLATSYKKQIAFGRAGALVILDPDASDDYDGSLIPSVLETGDFSWQAPNDIKRVFSLSLKVDRLLETATYFTVEGSTNRGLTWKNLGTLTIGVNEDEDEVGFKLMGSMIRFRLTTSTRIAPFTVAEVVLRMRGGGRELRFSTAD